MKALEQQVLEQLSEPGNYQNRVYRMIETQEQSATNDLVDDLIEQDMLEQLLDEIKPPYTSHAKSRHYLIQSPFRYPPLKHGSRFGSIQRPSFFYASESIAAVLAESAYYRLIFFQDIKVPYEGKVTSQHLSFAVQVSTEKMFDLTKVEDQVLQGILQHPSQYHTTQEIGKQLVDKGAEVIRYFSARSTGGTNVALSTSTCITSEAPEQQVRWQFQCRQDKVLMRSEAGGVQEFNLADFTVNNTLPRPA